MLFQRAGARATSMQPGERKVDALMQPKGDDLGVGWIERLRDEGSDG